ncbi:MAG: hypothetical protein ACXWV0_03035 [Flavisolibacter sp.]
MPTKNLRWVKLLFGLPLLFFFSSASSQNNPGNPNNWQLDATIDGVSFYHSIVQCNGSNVVLLKFENKNNYPVKVTWKEVFTTQIETKKEGFSGSKELVLAKGTTLPVACSDAADKKKIIRSSDVSPAYVAEISAFEFSKITVNKIN